MVMHNKKEFYIDVLEVRPPGDAICLIDTDCEVDFAKPLDYKEPEAERPEAKKEDDENKIEKVTLAVGSGGYAATVKGLTKVVIKEKIKDGGKEAGKEKFKAFTGRSYSLGGV
ncbi:hypothetical protein BUALT_Bualt16G0025600 [Buddleja alternifolia]|uniref:Ubiquitin fusion degradation protein UFD1 N-terminal subdomain 2 domain-containing protein n=1 Tax=Buddleja alternifolia TaxID=168488 RepID=A0AAV6WF18_9LAMI|nr:hypothetical protein BUALT_Bualt16G0025600 [Buddleja alternifolia]